MKRQRRLALVILSLILVTAAALFFIFRWNQPQGELSPRNSSTLDSAQSNLEDTLPVVKINPADLLSVVKATADGNLRRIVGVSHDDRFVLCSWTKANAGGMTVTHMPNHSPIESNLDITGFEVWDRLKGTRKRWNCFEDFYCHPSGTIVIQQASTKGSLLLTFSPITEQLTTILDTNSPQYGDNLSSGDKGLHLNSSGTSAFMVSERHREILQWNLDRRVVTQRLPVEVGGAILAVAPDCSRLAISYKAKNKAEIWDVQQTKIVSVMSLPEEFFGRYLFHSAEFLPDNRSLRLKEGLREEIVNTDNGQKYRAFDYYRDYDVDTRHWLRLLTHEWIAKPEGWEIVDRIEDAAPPLSRLVPGKDLQIRNACFIAGKGLVAASCDDNRSAVSKKRVIVIFEIKNGKVLWTVERDSDRFSDRYIDYDRCPTPTHDGGGLLFLTKHENQIVLECWKIPVE